jgi:cation:H+ antiporter
VTALLLSPIANELPETVNAIIWVRQGKTQPALGNISGAMMIQATVPQRLGSAVRRLALQQRPAVVRADHHGRHRAYLLATMRVHRLTPARLALAGGMYGALAVGLIPLLT